MKEKDDILMDKENASLREMNDELLRQQQDISAQLRHLSELSATQQHENKEMEIELNALKQQIQILKAQNIDPSKHETWDYENIIYWIMSLEDGRFSKYKEVLKKAFVEEELKGSDLGQVDINDVKNWGIKPFGDKKALFNHIQSLTKGTENEGGTAYI